MKGRLPRLILVEGLPGTGKSTLAKSLSSASSQRNIPVTLFLESQEKNPFRYGEGTSGTSPIDDFLAKVPLFWREFVKHHFLAGHTFIQEGMAFQQQVNFLTWMNRAGEIPVIVDTILHSVFSFDVALIYLRARDPIRAMQQTMLRRGPRWVSEKVDPIARSPFALERRLNEEGALNSFLLELQRTNDELFRTFPYRKLMLDKTTEDWPHLFRQAEEFLGV